jgi:tetratricopeptide (TPR) repeat protein
MLAKKNRLPAFAWLGCLLALLLAGCMPSGPRAVLKGKKLLESGDYAGAVATLRTATELLHTNAGAWNYLGVACQQQRAHLPAEAANERAQLSADAVTAYQTALRLDRNLVQAHWNLGLLYLEDNKNDLAELQFAAYTGLRNNSTEGWLKLGAAQLRLGEYAAAEKSFGAVRVLDPNNAAAWNGLGLARLERKIPREAMQFFAYANRVHPDYAPAILNLAVTAQQSLHDDRLALQYYQAYLALTPRPDHADDVSAIVNSLEQGPAVASVPPPAPSTEEVKPIATPPPAATVPPAPATGTGDTHRPTVTATHPAPAPKPAAVVVHTNPNPLVVVRAAPPVTEPVVKNPPAAPAAPAAAPAPVKTYNFDNPQVEPPPAETAAPEAGTPAKPGFWSRLKPTHWFGSDVPDKKYENSGLVPLPAPGAADSRPAETPAGPPVFPRYGYLAPARPAAGDRRAASGAFNKARMEEQASRWLEAMQSYRTAVEMDPAWFEAEYNFAVLSFQLGNHRQALAAYEQALAIQPDSVVARFNFALALKAAGHCTDAANELKKIIAAHPDDTSAHLALANLYAQKMRDPVQAREHYLKVLELDPTNSQAENIRYWLSVNSQ